MRQGRPVLEELSRDAESSFGARLRAIRDSRKLTQRKLADMLNITQAYLSRLEKDSRPASPNLISRVIAALGLESEAANELHALATKVPARLNPESPTIHMDSVRHEMESQKEAQEVWVVAESPLELDDADYRRLVVEGLLAADPRPYVYWTANTANFDNLSEMLLRDMGEDTESARLTLACNVICIKTPSPAAWFSFVIYDPRNTYSQPSAYLLSEIEGRPTGRVIPVGNTTWILRALKDLQAAYRDLVTLDKQQHTDSGGGIWSRHRLPEGKL